MTAKRKFRYRIMRVAATPTQYDLLPRRYMWSFEPADGYIGYSTSGESYTKMGALVKIKLLLWLYRRRLGFKSKEGEL
jgi:hypothetical protein